MYRVISTPSAAKADLSQRQPTVCVVDDDVSVRESLEMLTRSAGWQPIMFESAQSFLDSPSPSPPCCMVLDVNMPGLNGLDLQSLVNAEGGHIPIIFVSGFGDVPMTVRALKGGALDFLTKPIDTVAFLNAVKAALAMSEARHKEDEGASKLQRAFDSLTKREREVMVRVVRGLLNKQVAYELDISEITVKAHRGQVMRKMEARTVPDLVHMATRLGIDGPA